jgi:hypothetical protein
MRRIAWVLLGVVSCSDPPPFGTAEQICVDTINSYRAQLALPPYKLWVQAEACSNEQAQSDSETGIAHGKFQLCTENAQNECPGWPGPPEQMIPKCLALMWAEGPGTDFNTHGHYINMTSTQYTQVACGFYVMSDGTTVWSVQDFK